MSATNDDDDDDNNNSISNSTTPKAVGVGGAVAVAGVVGSLLVGMNCNADTTRCVYDEWAPNYEQQVQEWGYDMPEQVASLLAKYMQQEVAVIVNDDDWTLRNKNNNNNNNTQQKQMILDAGAGDGLLGVALRKHNFHDFKYTIIIGADLSSNMLQIAQSRGCYNHVQTINLNQSTLPYESNTFHAITCVGTLTYIDPKGCTLREFIRITQPGGYICFTHRTDKQALFAEQEHQLEDQGLWKSIEKLGPLPYLPNHPDFKSDIQVVVYLFQKI